VCARTHTVYDVQAYKNLTLTALLPSAAVAAVLIVGYVGVHVCWPDVLLQMLKDVFSWLLVSHATFTRDATATASRAANAHVRLYAHAHAHFSAHST